MNNLQQGAPAPHGQIPQQQQPAAQYSTEQQMQRHQGNQLVAVQVHLDNESIKILQEASGAHTESIINLGIKLFSKTNVYKEFMLNAEHKTLDVATEDLANITEIANTPVAPITSNNNIKETKAAPKAGGFASW